MRIELKDENQEEPQKIDENDIRYKHESDLTKKEKRELEKMKLSSMGLGGRLQYIWAYYKPQMAAVVAVIAILFVLACRHIYRATIGGGGCCGGGGDCPACRARKMKLHGGLKK